MKHFYKILAVLLTLFMIIAIIASISYEDVFKTEISSQIARYGLVGILVVSFTIEFLPQYFSPHILLIGGLISGVNPLFVLIGILLGTFLGSMAGFGLGSKIGENAVKDFFGKKKYARVKNVMNSYGKWYLALAAVSPLPYVPMIVGSLNMSYRNFIIFGIIPRMIGLIALAFLINGIF